MAEDRKAYGDNSAKIVRDLENRAQLLKQFTDAAELLGLHYDFISPEMVQDEYKREYSAELPLDDAIDICYQNAFSGLDMSNHIREAMSEAFDEYREENGLADADTD